MGEKRNRARARIKFLIAKLGIEEFKRLVLNEREILPFDERWTSYISELPSYGEKARKESSKLIKDIKNNVKNIKLTGNKIVKQTINGKLSNYKR